MNNEKTILDAFERGKAFGFAEGMKSMRVDAVNISKECVDKTQNNRHEPVAWMMKSNDPDYVSDYIMFKTPERKDKISHQAIPLYTHPVKEKDRFPKNFWEDTSATLENIQRADYIFTHYAKSDIIALARDLDRRDAKIAHPVKEQGNPVAWRSKDRDGYWCIYQSPVKGAEPLYTGFKELTDEEIIKLFKVAHNTSTADRYLIDFARAILRKAQE